MTDRDTFSDTRKPSVTISRFRIEHLRETLGIGTDRPRLSWMVETDCPKWRQAAYEIECYDADGKLRSQTGRVESDQSVLVAWPFEPLLSREHLTLRVRVWGKDGQASAWSQPEVLEAGLLQPADWTAHFITPDLGGGYFPPEPRSLSAPRVRTPRRSESGPAVYHRLGLYEAQINGAMVGDQVLAPGWTVYDRRLRYQTFDVTGMLHEGRNAIGAILADGWFRGRIGFGGGRRNIWGDHLALLAQLEISYEDGSSERIVTDETWRAATGPILLSGIYEGETYDARLEQPGWSSPGFDDAIGKPCAPA